jgi:hypothetical protein
MTPPGPPFSTAAQTAALASIETSEGDGAIRGDVGVLEIPRKERKTGADCLGSGPGLGTVARHVSTIPETETPFRFAYSFARETIRLSTLKVSLADTYRIGKIIRTDFWPPTVAVFPCFGAAF